MRKILFHVHVTIPNLSYWKYVFNICSSICINESYNDIVLLYIYEKIAYFLVFFKRIYNYVIWWRDSSLNCCPSQIETNNNTTRDLYYFWFIALSIFVNRNNFLTESDEEQKTVYLLINAKIRVRCAIRNHSSRK